MNRRTHPTKLALVCDYFPRQCGIATFSQHVYQALTASSDLVSCQVIPTTDTVEGYEYPDEVRFEIAQQDLKGYQRAADFLNFSNTEVVCVQHEFGIYGGPAGGHVLTLLRGLKIPVVTQLHTILADPTSEQRRVMQELTLLSSRFIVMAERGRDMLQNIYNVSADRIDVIPHGILDMPFVDPNFYKDQFGVEGKKVLLTFGLLSPGKGIEYVIRALPKIVEQVPNLVYIVLGATHPNLVREQGETYRLSLQRLASDLGMSNHVIFYDRFVSTEELKEFIGAADIYITPYLNPAQITSGTLSYAYGCGKPVVSTPYWHAEELLGDGRGILVPFRDSDAIAREVPSLLTDEVRLHSMRKQAYLGGREMIWSQVAEKFLDSFEKARKARNPQRIVLTTAAEARQILPALRLDHLKCLTDSTGIFQHASYSLPNFHEGYCTDDNARALLLTVMIEETGNDSPEVRALACSYAAYLNYAFNPAIGRFHNFMSFDRRWLDEVGSDDSHGRALWALGACVGRSKRRNLQHWAAQLFERALPAVEGTTSPRTWAFALVAIHEYFRRLSGDRLVSQLRHILSERLMDLYRHNSTPEWPWFEDSLTYANGRLSHALILCGRWGNSPEAAEIGVNSLKWLIEVQTSPAGHFRPIGSEGFYVRGSTRAHYDQQPIEAYTMICACIEAHAYTGEDWWLAQARNVFEWFLGKNDLGQPLYNPSTGGCCDALHVDRINLNQGAESTLAFLLSLQEMRLLEQSLASYNRLVKPDSIGANGATVLPEEDTYSVWKNTLSESGQRDDVAGIPPSTG